MAVYTINTERVAVSVGGSSRWHLDYPVKEMNIDSTVLTRDGLLFQGWLLNETESPVSLVILNGENVIPLPLTRNRPDVISKVLQQNPEKHEQLCCGFSEQVKLVDATFTIGTIADGKFTALLEGTVDGKFQILKGKDGWLFLDNDSNKSVEQYTGKMKLSRTARSEWNDYLSAVDNFSRAANTPLCLLVAPSKEMVYGQYYPHKFSRKAPIVKLIELVPESLSFIYPVAELKKMEQRSFRVCDTHWTLHGARLAAQLVASRLSSQKVEMFEVFDADEYRRSGLSGDLGSKLFPPQRHSEDSLTSFSYRNVVVFDNNIDNFGRIIVMHNSDAVLRSTLLLFGSSSSYTMFHYICRLYTTVIFVHTAGSLDHKIIEVIRPDCICLQTNARFVVKAPKFDDSVARYIQQKKASGTIKPPVIAKLLPREAEQYIDYFKQMLN